MAHKVQAIPYSQKPTIKNEKNNRTGLIGDILDILHYKTLS